MGSMMSSSAKSKEEPELAPNKAKELVDSNPVELALNKAKELVNSNPVFIFSKTYCGFCTRVKQLLTELGAQYKVMEIDRQGDGSDVQAALASWTGQRTVPNVFIGGKHIGGCDAIMAKHKQGKLVPLLTEAGSLGKKSAQL